MLSNLEVHSFRALLPVYETDDVRVARVQSSFPLRSLRFELRLRLRHRYPLRRLLGRPYKNAAQKVACCAVLLVPTGQHGPTASHGFSLPVSYANSNERPGRRRRRSSTHKWRFENNFRRVGGVVRTGRCRVTQVSSRVGYVAPTCFLCEIPCLYADASLGHFHSRACPVSQVVERLVATFLLQSIYASHPFFMNPFKPSLEELCLRERNLGREQEAAGYTPPNRALVWLLDNIIEESTAEVCFVCYARYFCQDADFLDS